MGAYDYYYRLKLNTPTNFTATAADCKASPFLQSLTHESFWELARRTIQSAHQSRVKRSDGQLPTAHQPDVSAGRDGRDINTGVSRYLKETIGVEFPVIRFENGDPSSGKRFFTSILTYRPARSYSQTPSTTTRFPLFSTASAAFAWTSIAAGRTGSLLQKGRPSI